MLKQLAEALIVAYKAGKLKLSLCKWRPGHSQDDEGQLHRIKSGQIVIFPSKCFDDKNLKDVEEVSINESDFAFATDHYDKFLFFNSIVDQDGSPYELDTVTENLQYKDSDGDDCVGLYFYIIEDDFSSLFALVFGQTLTTEEHWVPINAYSEVKEGDKVKVVCKVERHEDWDNSWVGSMDLAIGQIFTVKGSDRTGISFKERGQRFPRSGCMKLVSKQVVTAPISAAPSVPSESTTVLIERKPARRVNLSFI